MIIYSKTEERFLKYIGYHPSVEEGVTWKAIRYSALQSFAPFFVKLDHVYERGLDVEELSLALSGDADQAWETAVEAGPHGMRAKKRKEAEKKNAHQYERISPRGACEALPGGLLFCL